MATVYQLCHQHTSLTLPPSLQTILLLDPALQARARGPGCPQAVLRFVKLAIAFEGVAGRNETDGSGLHRSQKF